jgi:hypothetical protein
MAPPNKKSAHQLSYRATKRQCTFFLRWLDRMPFRLSHRRRAILEPVRFLMPAGAPKWDEGTTRRVKTPKDSQRGPNGPKRDDAVTPRINATAGAMPAPAAGECCHATPLLGYRRNIRQFGMPPTSGGYAGSQFSPL